MFKHVLGYLEGLGMTMNEENMIYRVYLSKQMGNTWCYGITYNYVINDYYGHSN